MIGTCLRRSGCMTIDFLFDAYNAASWLLWIFRIPVRWKGANILALKPLFSHETRLICVFDLLPEINGHFVFLRFENGKKDTEREQTEFGDPANKQSLLQKPLQINRLEWWARQVSNLRPSDYESPALTPELRAQVICIDCLPLS